MVEGWNFEWKDVLCSGVLLLELQKISHCQLVHCYQYGLCSEPYHWHLEEVLATIGEGTVEFTSAVGVGVVGMGWAITLTLYLLLTTQFFSFLVIHLGFWGFSGHGVGTLGVGAGAWLWLGWSQLGCCGWVWFILSGFVVGTWVWHQTYPLIPNIFSSFG